MSMKDELIAYKNGGTSGFDDLEDDIPSEARREHP